MKLAKVTFMLATVALLGAGCSEQGGSGSSKLIEKPQVTVENGAFTPEVLNAFGRVSDIQVSPDEKSVVLISTVKYGKTAQDHHPDLDKTKARIIDDLMYKQNLRHGFRYIISWARLTARR